MRSWILSMSLAALLALAAPFYALWADTPPGNPSDPAYQPTVPAAEQPAGDTGEMPGADPLAGTPPAARASAAEPDTLHSPGGPGDEDTAAPPNTRLAAALPPGASEADACSGFKSASECRAALHAAHNLDIPFSALKSRVTAGQRLTAAVTTLKPGADAKAEVRRAEEQAQLDTRAPRG
jgi:hypothetical protein